MYLMLGFWLSSILRIAFRRLSTLNMSLIALKWLTCVHPNIFNYHQLYITEWLLDAHSDPTSATVSSFRVLFTLGGKVDGLAAFSIFHLLVCASREENHNVLRSTPNHSLRKQISFLVIAIIDPGTKVQKQGYHRWIPFRCHHGQFCVSTDIFTRNQEVSIDRCIKNSSEFSFVTEDTMADC